MKKAKILRRLSECVMPHRISRVFMENEGDWNIHLFPLKVSEDFLLGAIEDDFQLDGFRICPVSRIGKVKKCRDKCMDIEAGEGIVDQLYTPNVSISGWRQIFRSLKNMNRYVILDTRCGTYIGAITRIGKKSVTVKYFDADGVWFDPVKIRFKDIDAVDFGTRYVDVFTKYVTRI